MKYINVCHYKTKHGAPSIGVAGLKVRRFLNEVLVVDQEWESWLLPRRGAGALSKVPDGQRAFTRQLNNSLPPGAPLMCDSLIEGTCEQGIKPSSAHI